MCNPLVLMAASTAVSVKGSLDQGAAAQSAANADASMLDYQAAVDRDNAAVEAKRIRRAGDSARGETLAGIAAAGVKVGQGSALDAEREVMTDTETDAFMALLNGERAARGKNLQADNARRSGRDARKASYFNAAGSLLSAGGQGYRMGMFKTPGGA